jgi:tRNA threonylcarbamoyladenosine biosynthesis protein TsaB
MNYILHIDTATETASVCLSSNNKIIDFLDNNQPKNHASFLQPAIEQLLAKNNILISQICAISVSNGPGSYTGLRVGLASAKGLCFALSIPLITISTLEIIANAALELEKTETFDLVCATIDARRLEVFTAIYNKNLHPILQPTNLVLDAQSFDEILNNNKVLFIGSGAKKTSEMLQNNNAIYSSIVANASNMIFLATQKFNQNLFEDLSYCVPFYGKEFYSTMPKKLV